MHISSFIPTSKAPLALAQKLSVAWYFMDCLVRPVALLSRRCSGSRLRYQQLVEDGLGEPDGPVTVVVGKERREFLVDAYVLEENPFRVLIDAVTRKEGGRGSDARKRRERRERVIFIDVDAILFEHMLWLMHNDWPSLFQLNVEEIIDFYAQEN
ncbi:auxin-responsive protein SAUR77 [Eucalyptus grandis]|uniref:auxin-responsive protein SAUR77 n=1 Tax=Eucalyptus grandis TaxID=71139 RepID=UPI00192EB46B|nr:auxin-responsive protein SAUR77 [Eucalyptus grandis]